MIKALFVAGTHGDDLQSVPHFQLLEGAGIVGDRHFKQSIGPGQYISFIGIEAGEHCNRHCQQSFTTADTRRSVLTQGIDLNALVGRRFSIGEVQFKGVELCEPCRALGDRLCNDTISSPEVVKALLHSGGLRADVCSDGVIKVGMSVDLF